MRFPGLEAVQPGVGTSCLVHGGVEVHHLQTRQVMTLADHEVVEVVRGGDLHRPRSLLGVGMLVGDDRNRTIDQGQDHVLADEVLVAFVARVHRHRHVTEHGLGTRGRHHEVPLGLALDRVAQMPELAVLVLGLDLLVGERGHEGGTPVDQALAAIDEPLLEELDEGRPHRVRKPFIHREALVLPVAAGAEAAELLDDAPAVLLLPLPGALDEGVATELVLGLALLGQRLLDHALRSDAGVVGAGHPQGLVATHAVEAHLHVLQGVVEGVPHVQDTGDVGRRDDDDEAAVPLGHGAKRPLLGPTLRPAGLDVRCLVPRREFGAHGVLDLEAAFGDGPSSPHSAGPRRGEGVARTRPIEVGRRGAFGPRCGDQNGRTEGSEILTATDWPRNRHEGRAAPRCGPGEGVDCPVNEVLFVVNRRAGRPGILEAAEAARRRLEARGQRAHLHPTDSAEAARALVQSTDLGTLLVAVGGDGTLRNLATATLDTPRPLGLLPRGTANVVARELGIPFAPKKAADLLLDGAPRRLDLGRLGDGAFLAMVGVGLDGRIVEGVGPGRFKMARMAWSTVRTLISPKLRPLRITADGAEVPEAMSAFVCNTRNYGGYFALCPEARADDGRLEIFGLKSSGFGGLLRALLAASRGRHVAPSLGHYAAGTTIEIAATDGSQVPVQADGDFVGHTPVQIKLQAGAFQLIAPPLAETGP